jgi:glutaredoxin-like YruB-family protein
MYSMALSTIPITIYSADWCAFCHAAKGYLDKLGIQYVDKNVENDPSYAQESVDKSGQMGIPVIDIDGMIVIGFDRPKLDAILREKKLI